MDDRRNEICALLEFYGALLSESRRRALELYYIEDFSLAEIGEDIGISRQGVRDAIKRGESELFRMEEALSVLARSRATAELTAKISALTDNAEIKRLAAEIADL